LLLRMHSGEAANTNFIIFALIRTGSEPVIYSTHGEQAYQYTNNVV
jgi:hypothetical protein